MSQTSMWAWTATAFFAVGLGLVLTMTPEQTTQTNPLAPINYLAQLCFLAFHLALLPVITNMNAPTWAKGSGYAWIAVDNVIVVMTITGVDAGITGPARLGIHIAAATWILACSLASNNQAVRWVGSLAGIWVGGYSLLAPYVPPNLFFGAAFTLLLWCITLGVTQKQAPTPMETPATTA